MAALPSAKPWLALSCVRWLNAARAQDDDYPSASEEDADDESQPGAREAACMDETVRAHATGPSFHAARCAPRHRA